MDVLIFLETLCVIASFRDQEKNIKQTSVSQNKTICSKNEKDANSQIATEIQTNYISL